MTPREFQYFLARDKHCYHCGATDDLIPQHRANRGMGGSRARNVPSNIIAFCSQANSRLESDAGFAKLGRDAGWKLDTWQDPLTASVYDTTTETWYALDNAYGRIVVTQLEL